MLTNNSSFKNETLYNGQFEITKCWTNGKVALYLCAIKIRYNIRQIKPCIFYANIEDIKY